MIKLEPRLDTQQPAGKTFSIIHIITIMAVERGGGAGTGTGVKVTLLYQKIALFPVFLKRYIYETFYILHYDYIFVCFYMFIKLVSFIMIIFTTWNPSWLE